MQLPKRPGSYCKAVGPQLLLALAVAAVCLSVAGEALALERLAGERQAVERWKHPPGRAGAGQFRALRQGPSGPNAAGPNVAGPNAAESNARAGAINQREPVGNIQAEGRPFEPNRSSANPAERGGAEFQRLETNPGGRGPAELQRPGFPGQNAARGPFQRGPAAGGFAQRALAERNLQGPNRFGRGQLAGRFQARPFAGLIARRPLIGERGFTGVPPAGETRFLTNEMVFHVPSNVSPQTVDTVARRLGLSTIASLAAPGVDILEPAPNGGYQVTTGTSVEAAHVSGIAALLIDHDPTLDAAAIREILTSSAKHHAPTGRDDQFGWGVVDPYRALTAPDAKVAKDGAKQPKTDGAAAPRPVSAR